MANTRISDLTASASNLASTDLAPVVQTAGVGPVKMTGAQIAAGLLSATTPIGGGPILSRAAAATLQLGAADAAGSAIAISSVASNQLTLASNHGLSNGAAVIITGSAAPSGTTLNTLYYARSISAAVLELYDTYQNAITTSGTTGRVSVTTAGTSASVRLSTPFQTFQPQSFTGTDIPGQPFIIKGSRGTGTGPGGSIIFQVAPAGNSGTAQNAYSTQFQIVPSDTSTGSANTVTVAAGPKQGTLGTGLLIVNGGTVPAGSGAGHLVVTSARTDHTIFNVQNSSVSSNNGSWEFGVAGSASAVGAGAFYFYNNGGNTANMIMHPTNSCVGFGNIVTTTNLTSAVQILGNIGFTSASGTAPDVTIYRDTTNTLALRNGTSAQTFNVYNTYTSSTNYETFKIDWITTANTCLIGTEKGSGGGSARALALQTDGTTRLTIETNGDLTIADAENIIVGSTTGTKIGTATSQKIGFWNATPIVQPTTGVAAATVAATGVGDVVAASTTFDGYTIPQIVKAMRNAGLLA